VDNDNIYQAPKADLRIRPPPMPPGPAENFLRMTLLVVFGFYAVMHCIFVPFAFMVDGPARTLVLVVNTLLVAIFSILSFLATKRRQPKVLLHAMLLFAAGFGGTALYRLGFVAPIGWIDFKNGLMFGIPALLAFAYCRMLARRVG